MINEYLEWAILRNMDPDDLGIEHKENGDVLLYDKKVK